MEQPGKTLRLAKPQTNFLDLPRDAMIVIFTKLGPFDLLLNAQRVCSSWRAIAKDPQLYRVIRIVKRFFPKAITIEAIAIEAIKRSRGQLVQFSIEGFCTNRIMYALMHNAPMLKRFRLREGLRISDVFLGCPKLPQFMDCPARVSDACLIEVFANLPLLEKVEFLDCYSMTGVMEVIARSCPNLKLLRLNPLQTSEESCFGDEEAFAVAGSVNPGLQRLDLSGTSVTNAGLEALLERCTLLEYLGIRDCYNIKSNGDLTAKFERIKRVSRIFRR